MLFAETNSCDDQGLPPRFQGLAWGDIRRGGLVVCVDPRKASGSGTTWSRHGYYTDRGGAKDIRLALLATIAHGLQPVHAISFLTGGGSSSDILPRLVRNTFAMPSNVRCASKPVRFLIGLSVQVF